VPLLLVKTPPAPVEVLQAVQQIDASAVHVNGAIGPI
jgi:hypothetical protein